MGFFQWDADRRVDDLHNAAAMTFQHPFKVPKARAMYAADSTTEWPANSPYVQLSSGRSCRVTTASHDRQAKRLEREHHESPPLPELERCNSLSALHKIIARANADAVAAFNCMTVSGRFMAACLVA